MRTTIMTIEELLEQPEEYETYMSKAIKRAYRLGRLQQEVDMEKLMGKGLFKAYDGRLNNEIENLKDFEATFPLP